MKKPLIFDTSIQGTRDLGKLRSDESAERSVFALVSSGAATEASLSHPDSRDVVEKRTTPHTVTANSKHRYFGIQLFVRISFRVLVSGIRWGMLEFRSLMVIK